MKRFILWDFVWLLVAFVGGSINSQPTALDRHNSTVQLYSNLLLTSNYNKNVIPAPSCRDRHEITCPFIVQVRLFLIRIQDLIETQETLISTIRLQLSWFDPGLQWKTADYNGIDSLTIPGGTIWEPDLQFANSVDDMYTLLLGDAFGFRLAHTGEVWYHPTGKISTRCAIDLKFYPFDYQQVIDAPFWRHFYSNFCNRRCSIVVESVIYPSDELQLIVRPDKPDPVSLGMFTENSLWKVEGVTGYPVFYKSGEKTAFSRIHFWILLKRDPHYYRDTFLIPIALLSVLQVMTYLIPMHYVDRVPQATVVLLTAFVLESYMADKLPKSSQPSLIQTYLNIVIGVSVAAIGISILTLELLDPDEDLEWWGLKMLRHGYRRKPRNNKKKRGINNDNHNLKPKSDIQGIDLDPVEEPPRSNIQPMRTSIKVAAAVNTLGFIASLLITILYPAIAFYGYVSMTPPALPQPPPYNMSTSYYAES